MKNILFSTTSQWNPGDEFIFQGVLNVLRDSGLEFNPIIYNRNPLINPPRPPTRANRDEAGLRENSFDLGRPVPVDYVIFAGTPEWMGGRRVEPLLEFIKSRGVRCSFLGVGLSGEATPSKMMRSILENQTDVFVCRDKTTLESVKDILKAELTTCPSILSSKTARARTAPGRVGCGIQGTTMLWQSISAAVQAQLYASYARIAQKQQVEYVAHYIDDLNNVPKGSGKVHYSGRAQDFLAIYDQFDLVISPRLHGCGVAASLGIPSICLAHDKRGVAAELFGAVVVDSPANLDKIVDEQDWAARSENVLNLKKQAGVFYQSAIRPILARLSP